MANDSHILWAFGTTIRSTSGVASPTGQDCRARAPECGRAVRDPWGHVGTCVLRSLLYAWAFVILLPGHVLWAWTSLERRSARPVMK